MKGGSSKLPTFLPSYPPNCILTTTFCHTHLHHQASHTHLPQSAQPTQLPNRLPLLPTQSACTTQPTPTLPAPTQPTPSPASRPQHDTTAHSFQTYQACPPSGGPRRSRTLRSLPLHLPKHDHPPPPPGLPSPAQSTTPSHPAESTNLNTHLTRN